MTHPLNQDPFAKPSSEADYGNRHPRRFEAQTSTLEATQPQQRARAHVHCPSGFIAIATAADTALLFDVIDFDNVGLYTPNRFTIPTTGKVTGSWLIHGHATWAGDAAGTFRKLWIRQNGSTAIRTAVFSPVANPQSLNVTALINDPIPGTYFELVARHDAGHNVNVIKEPDQTYFSIIHLW